ncbi:hypothetical protein N177_3584 [Lutibaculum baratangense AMV1]|uniref:Uncharacterized protein n=1 Tax=Lutibaculum baratangense AMV1 TaxID=631454 RepID=V4RBJ3_9HYPH|nr:hypothetical protein N177_3584 [Lutibaculum baratangense AMV1]
MVAHAMHPPREPHGLPDPGLAELAAGVRPIRMHRQSLTVGFTTKTGAKGA